jgi:hypothetical protein
MQPATANLNPFDVCPLPRPQVDVLELLTCSGKAIVPTTRSMPTPAASLRTARGLAKFRESAEAQHLAAARDLYKYLTAHAPSGVYDEVWRLLRIRELGE